MADTRRRLLLGAPLLAAALVAGAGWWSHRVVRRTLESKLQDDLQTVLNANVTALEIWLNTQTRLAGVLAGDPKIRELTLDLVRLGSNPQANPPGPGLQNPAVATELQKVLDARIQSSGYGAVLVLNTNLQILATSARARNRQGEQIEHEHAARVQEAFTEGRPVLITPFKAGFGRPSRRGGAAGTGPGMGRPGTPTPPEGSRYGPPDRPTNARPGGLSGRGDPPGRPDLNLMELVTPVLDEAGHAAAAIAFVLRPEEEFTRVLSVARPGESGETFAF
ncbi:MAG: hypothetical protein J0L84_17605, partial [Verrucomicrobia bacterium]|nr:hypothetical protein [Verrucomicrobiota bacterium]